METPYLVFIFTLTFTLTLICISINSYKLKSARKALFYGLFKFLYKRQNGKKADPLKRAIPLDKSYVPSGLVVTDENENNFHNFVDPNFKPMIKDFVFDYFDSFNESAILDGYNYIIVDIDHLNIYKQYGIIMFLKWD